MLLKDRLYESLGHTTAAVKRPFNIVNVMAEKPKQQPVVEPVRAPAGGQRSRTTSANYYQVWIEMINFRTFFSNFKAIY